MPQRSRLAKGLAVTAMLSALAAVVPARALAAQTVTVTGTVRADSTTPLAGALVSLDPGGKPAGMRTDASGRFKFEEVPPGQHVLSVFASGQTSVQRLVEVADKDLQIDVVMHPAAHSLDTVSVIAKRTGVYGYVGDLSNLQPLPGAVVQVLGARMADTTDSAARFDLPKVHDDHSYVVRVSHPGYKDKLVSVSVPKKEGYELGVFLSPTTEVAVKQNTLWREMDERVTWGGMNAALLTRKDLGTNPRSNLATMVQFGAARQRNGMHLSHAASMGGWEDSSYPCIFVNGRYLGRGITLDMFDVGDVEAVEIYGKDARQWVSQLQSEVLRTIPGCGSTPMRYTTDGIVGHYTLTPAAAMAEARQQIVAIVIWLKR